MCMYTSIPYRGNNNNTGTPIFLNDKSFIIFSISDALALFSSVTSILMFLSILTSRYAEEDFLQVFVEEADYWPNNTLLFYSIDAYSFQCKLFHCSWSSSGMDYCPSCSHCLHSSYIICIFIVSSVG
ncbi:ankyrin repeat-containing protein NPR4-like [Forsythia ovata]|uniref:Ankyrin repeat-containing protein NPR4-like n=1 Tax=Forsythia ovata TaxID=205694 RepID=A0ABD1S0Z9_9LAMI